VCLGLRRGVDGDYRNRKVDAMSDDKFKEAGQAWHWAFLERQARERHDEAHPGDPTQWYQDCQICADRFDKHKKTLAIDKSIDNDIDYATELKHQGMEGL
jgi:hypothetical protein